MQARSAPFCIRHEMQAAEVKTQVPSSGFAEVEQQLPLLQVIWALTSANPLQRRISQNGFVGILDFNRVIEKRYVGHIN